MIAIDMFDIILFDILHMKNEWLTLTGATALTVMLLDASLFAMTLKKKRVDVYTMFK